MRFKRLSVTARKRAEALQTVPLAITAFSAAQIERSGIQDLNDVANQTAGLTYTEIGGSGLTQTPIIRGLVSGNVFSGGVNNVSVFLDGVYISSRNALDLQTLDTERVEVLKGPQSTLFGQNSYAGAINYISKLPGDHWEGEAIAEVGTNAWYQAGLAGGGPVTDNLGVRAAFSTGGFDGTFHNTGDPSKNLQGFQKPQNWSGSAVFTPIESLTLTARVLYGENDRDQDANVIFPNNCGKSATGAFTRFCGTVPTFTEASINPKGKGAQSSTFVSSFNIDYAATDELTLSSLSSYEYDSETSLLDAAYNANGFPTPVINTVTGLQTGVVGAPVFYGAGSTTDHDVSEEMRAHYQWNWLNVTVGGFYYTTTENVNTNFSVDNSQLGPNQRYGYIYAVLLGTPNPFTKPVLTTVTSEFREDLAGFRSGSG